MVCTNCGVPVVYRPAGLYHAPAWNADGQRLLYRYCQRTPRHATPADTPTPL